MVFEPRLMDDTPDKPDQPDFDTKYRTLTGARTGWTFDFDPPPCCHADWGINTWIKYIGNNWRRILK